MSKPNVVHDGNGTVSNPDATECEFCGEIFTTANPHQVIVETIEAEPDDENIVNTYRNEIDCCLQCAIEAGEYD